MGRDTLITVGSIQEYCRRRICEQLNLAEISGNKRSKMKHRVRASELSEFLGWLGKRK